MEYFATAGTSSSSLRALEAERENILSYYFVGTSYFYENLFPILFFQNFMQAEVDATSVNNNTVIQVDTSNYPARTWNLQLWDPFTRRRFYANHYEWVFLQESSGVPAQYDEPIFQESTESLKKLHKLAGEAGAKTMVVITWGSLSGSTKSFAGGDGHGNYTTYQDRLNEGFFRYMEAVNVDSDKNIVYFAPVGLVWQKMYQDQLDAGVKDPASRENEPNLFSGLAGWDKRHPSLGGSYLMLLTIWSTMTGKSPFEATHWCPRFLERDRVLAIQDAVSRTILETFHSGQIVYPWSEPFPVYTADTVDNAAFISRCFGEGSITIDISATVPVGHPPMHLALSLNYWEMGQSLASKFYLRKTFQANSTATGEYRVRQTLEDFSSGERYAFRILLLDEDDNRTAAGITDESMDATSNNVSIGTDSTLQIRILDKDNASIWSSESSAANYLSILQAERFLEVTIDSGDKGSMELSGTSHTYLNPPRWLELTTDIWNRKGGKHSRFWWFDSLAKEYARDSGRDTAFALMVNVYPDNAPEETSWRVSKLTSSTNSVFPGDRSELEGSWYWKPTHSWRGADAVILLGTQSPGSYTTWMSDLEAGWYQFVLHDSAGNGMCCDNGTGYVTLLGKVLYPDDRDKEIELIWGSNGSFSQKTSVYFEMGSEGTVDEIAFSETAAIRSAAESLQSPPSQSSEGDSTNILAYLLNPVFAAIDYFGSGW